MAANDYYNQPIEQQKPTRRSDAPLPPTPDSYTAYNPYGPSSTNSLFSTPFDDPSLHSKYSHHQQNQQNLGSDSRYYGPGSAGRPSEPSSYSEDIPLRSHQAKHNLEQQPYDQMRQDNEAAYAARLHDQQNSHPRRRRRKGRFFKGPIPWVVYTFTLIQIVVFIAELGRNGALTGSPIEIHPQFNPMIGPSPYVLINMGARYVPCMRNSSLVHSDIRWPSASTTTADTSKYDSTLSDLCGFGGFKITNINQRPNQWYRFIIPIYLHAGIIHIGFNMLLQMTLGKEMEQDIGSLRFLLVYLSSGIFGFALGGNFAAEGIASTGASGALFGIIALMLLDLLFHWGERRSPWVDLAWIVFEVVVSFVLGLLPGLDNFSHIGGFLMGLVLGICLLHSPDVLRRRIGADDPPYAPVQTANTKTADESGIKVFVKEPVGFFKGRKPLWWLWWLVRAGALIGVLVSFILLLENFYKRNPTKCHWCKYLTCIVSSSPCIPCFETSLHSTCYWAMMSGSFLSIMRNKS